VRGGVEFGLRCGEGASGGLGRVRGGKPPFPFEGGKEKEEH